MLASPRWRRKGTAFHSVSCDSHRSDADVDQVRERFDTSWLALLSGPLLARDEGGPRGVEALAYLDDIRNGTMESHS